MSSFARFETRNEGPSRPYGAMRFAASVLCLVSGILDGVSSVSSWWAITLSGSSGSGTVSFLPGGSYEGSFGGSSGSATYTSGGLGYVGSLYEGVLALALIGMVLALAAGVLGVLAARGRRRSLGRYRTVRRLVLAVLVIALLAIIIVPALQPTLFGASNPSDLCTSALGSSTPCNSFWGSASANGENVTWGAEAGWFLTLGAAVLLVAAFALWRGSASDRSGNISTPSRWA